MNTDPIADMLTRIRNGLRIYREHVDMPISKVKKNLAAVLKREGYIRDFEAFDVKPQGVLRVHLKYGDDGEQVIQVIERVSKPGRRIYAGVETIKPVLSGLGTGIFSTSKGLLSDRECRAQKIGGEYLCRVT